MNSNQSGQRDEVDCWNKPPLAGASSSRGPFQYLISSIYTSSNPPLAVTCYENRVSIKRLLLTF